MEILARGAHGVIYTVDDNTVLKQAIIRNRGLYSAPLSELDILRQTQDHPGFIRLKSYTFEKTKLPHIEIREHESLDHLCLYLEKAESDLSGQLDKLGSLNLEEVYKMSSQLLGALEYLHEQVGYLHLDLHPGNVLYCKDERYALCDFGLSRPRRNNLRSDAILGIHDYQAPEMILSENLIDKSDLWSLGCCCYLAYTGEDLMNYFIPSKSDDIDRRDVVSKIEQDIKKILDVRIPDKDFRNFLSSILVVDPDGRSTIKEALEHPFIKRYRNQSPLPIKKSSTMKISLIPTRILDQMIVIDQSCNIPLSSRYRYLFMALSLILRLPSQLQLKVVYDMCMYLAMKYQMIGYYVPEDLIFEHCDETREAYAYICTKLDRVYEDNIETYWNYHNNDINDIMFDRIMKVLRNQQSSISISELYIKVHG